MLRILTGIQSSGSPHLGNLYGAIIPSIELANNSKNESFFFIADLHSLTSLKDVNLREQYIIEIAATWLAFGLNTERTIFFRQSRIPEVCELKWYLECFSPYPMLANAHSFKDKSTNLSDVNAGLFTYPILMAADILLYDVDIVPVGKDQKQHMEITRDIARIFNNYFGKIFKIPKSIINKEIVPIPGTDGRKMSKSYNNTINIFLPETKLKKQIMSIKTDSKTVEQPKDPNQCNIFQLYSILATNEQVQNLKAKYIQGNFGYGHAKQELFELILIKFYSERKEYNKLIADREKIINILQQGEKKAKEIAVLKMDKIRKKMKYM